MKEPNQDCVFCREFSGSRDTNFAKRYPEHPTRIIGETDSLVAFPCIGQISAGHFLIAPKNHDATFRDLSIRLSDFPIELKTLLRNVHRAIGANENTSFYFEHGARSVEDGGCGIYHAHLHVVPSASHIDPKELLLFADDERTSCLGRAWLQVAHAASYALMGSMDHGFYSQQLAMPLPSQSLRRAIAKALGVQQWDWRQYGREEAMLAVLEKVSAQ